MKKHLQSLFALLVLAGCFTALSAAPDRFDRTKTKIEALFHHRQNPDPLPAKPANPFAFAPPGGSILATEPTQPLPPVNTLSDDDQILAYCAGRLRIGGLVQLNGRAHLLINSSTYQEADLIPVRGSGETVYYVKVVRITGDTVVFGYNEAVLTLPIRT